MKLAMEAAKFTPEEANGLRRSMATFRNMGTVGDYGVKFVEGMVRRGYDPEFAQRCFSRSKASAPTAFPRATRSASPSWSGSRPGSNVITRTCSARPAQQPADGLLSASQLVRDAREHGVVVLEPDVMLSDWDSKLECLIPPSPSWGGTADAQHRRVGMCGAVRARSGDIVVASDLPHPDRFAVCPSREGREVRGRGARVCPFDSACGQIRGLKDTEIEALVKARAAGASTLEDLARHARLSRRALELLAEADAFRSLGMDRREGLWRVKAMTLEARTPALKANEQGSLLAGLGLEEDPVTLPACGCRRTWRRTTGPPAFR